MKDYEVRGVIGLGAYGVVLKCVDKKTGKIVAIKKFRESDENPIIRKISLREMHTLKNVSHPNVVKFLKAFRNENKLHLVFEYLPMTILDFLEENKVL